MGGSLVLHTAATADLARVDLGCITHGIVRQLSDCLELCRRGEPNRSHGLDRSQLLNLPASRMITCISHALKHRLVGCPLTTRLPDRSARKHLGSHSPSVRCSAMRSLYRASVAKASSCHEKVYTRYRESAFMERPLMHSWNVPSGIRALLLHVK